MNGPPTRLRHCTLGMRARRFLSARGGRLDARAVLRLPVLLVQPGRSERESVAQPVALARFRRDDVFLANNVCCVCVRVCVSARLRLFARD